MATKHEAGWAIRVGLAVTIVAGVASCVGIAVTEIVPTVSLAMVDPGSDAESLSRGRQTYLARCAGCHRALPVRDYSREQWERVLPGMARLAKLNSIQIGELRGYILAAIRGTDRSAEGSAGRSHADGKADGK
jgi:mono/diheme cytochrome c family protein